MPEVGRLTALPLVREETVLVGCRKDCRFRLPDMHSWETVVVPVGSLREGYGFVTRYQKKLCRPVCGASLEVQDALAQRRQEIYQRAFAERDRVYAGQGTALNRSSKAAQVFQEIAAEYIDAECPYYESVEDTCRKLV